MSGRKIVVTSDSTTTLYHEELGEHYHSIHGAKNESMHVFLEAGLLQLPPKSVINVFEVGLGTGLNAFLTAQFAQKHKQQINYTAVEKYPVSIHCAGNLNFGWGSNNVLKQLFMDIHQCKWGEVVELDDYFQFTKFQADLLDFKMVGSYDLVYFDAFSPEKQPEMWSGEVFGKLYSAMNKGGLLTTYCAKGQVRRTLQQVGFLVERIPGPHGKREMLRATKQV